MEISIDLVVQSHLSDSMVEISNKQGDTAYNRIKFVKKLLHLRSINKIGHRIDEEFLDQLWEETINSKDI
jgi:hypothetical protein